MLAVRYCGASKPFALQTVPLPTHLPGHVLVQIKASALCHTELHFMDGTLNFGVNNITMGHETVGIITAVGDGVESSRVGERVIVYYYIGCQQCKHCKKGNQQLCGSMKGQHGFLSDGGLAEYILTPSRNAIVLPESLSFESAAPIGCGVTTAVHACKLAKPEADEWVAIFGVNGVGFSIIQLAKHFKCKVIAISRSVDKLSKATELGADAVVDATDSSTVANKIREITGGEGADIIFECVGDRTTMDQCVGWGGALAKRGRLVFIGYKAGNEHEFRVHPIPLLVYEQHILGSVGATLEDLKEAVEYVGNGIISTVVDSCISIQDFQLAYNRMLTCKCVGKIVMNSFT